MSVSGTFDLDAYCRRIGYAGERAPTLAALREIHRLQPQAIAFENLSPLLGQPVPLDDTALQEKMVHRGRGGYCFEQNLLFAAALRGFGFKLRWLTGWPRWQIAPGRVLPRTHLLLLIDLDGEQWLADVGFGGNTLTVEVFLFDFEGDLYGRLLSVFFVQRLRGEKRFASIPPLQQQMGRDVENAKRILA